MTRHTFKLAIATANGARRFLSARRRRRPGIWTAGLFFVCLLCCRPIAVEATNFPPFVKNLSAWYDASQTGSVTTASNPSVSQWNDLSGNGETLAQSTSGSQPTYITNCVNGLACVSYNGSQFLVSNDTNISRFLYPASTVFTVENPSSSSDAATIFSGNNTARYNLSIPGTAVDFGVCCTDRISAAASAAVNEHLWTTIGGVSANILQLNQDGTSVASGTTSSLVSLTCSMTVGGQGTTACHAGGFSYGLFGSIEEIVVYNVVLSQANYQYIEGYLACKWGIQGNLPSSHPYYSTCPSGTPSTAGISGLSAWYDASKSSSITTTTNAGVSTLNDLSGNGITVAQSTAADQPTYSTNCINSLACLVFNGSSDFLYGTTGFPTTSSYSILAVAKFGAATSNNILSSYYDTGTAHAFLGGGSEAPSLWQTATFAIGTTTGTSVFLATATYVNTSGFGSVYVNGGTAATGTTTNKPVTDASIEIGGNAGASNYLTGNIAELILYNSALSTAEQQYLEGYLAWKWGLQASLPVGHPYKSAAPGGTVGFTLSTAVAPTGAQVVGTNLTYTTTYTNGGGILNYNPTVIAPVPTQTAFELGTATSNLSTTGLTVSVSYSNNAGSTYVYTPVSAGGGAPAGYDATVNDVKWSFTGALGCGSVNNTGTVAFVARIQ